MIAVLAIGALALLVLLWVAGKFSQGDPRRLADLFRKFGKQALGAGLLAFSAFAAMRQNWMPAVILAPIGLGLLQTSPFGLSTLGGGLFGRSGRRSRLSSAYFEIILDQDSGLMSGQVVAGAYIGRELVSIDPAGLLRLRQEVAHDPDSLALIEAYLDRRLARWRENVNQNPGARQGGSGRQQAMTEQEAYQVLGLEPGAKPDAIRAAHRTLMKRLHPDTGGSNWLAAKVNTAKDVLLAGH